MNTDILSEGSNFKTFLKKPDTILLDIDSCYTLLKNDELELEHDVDSAYGVCIQLTFLNLPTDSINSFQLKRMMNLIPHYSVKL